MNGFFIPNFGILTEIRETSLRNLFIFATWLSLVSCAPEKSPPPEPLANNDINPNGFVGTPKEAAAKLNESIVLRDNPDMATRTGDTLAIHYRGETLVRYTDDPKGCDRYVVERAVKVLDPMSGRLEAIALIACHFGITTNRYLVLPNTGKYAVTDDVASSPNGKHLATSDATVTRSRGAFIIADWPDIEERAEFPMGCTHITWQDNTHLTADCWRSDHPNTLNVNESDTVFFSAKIWRNENIWTAEATRWLERETFAPKSSPAPLPRYTARTKSGVDAPA